ncbi:hypothetical protein [Pseudoalteromonas sp. NZS100]|uniref:hypothetical protein n=1 Tax=Pseudoalteromonas sp. NZS100 TaxID=2792046 RepID=UPI0018CF3A7E|nr:hypothetical protein [Pseudoalteromonas sp. NZS100]MBH0069336.1 hypothetical protein [Pseudoalteromonas sp. NZS100]
MNKGVELAAELTEVAVKSQLLTGIAKDIPYVSTLLKAWNLSDSIRDRMFVVKVMRFLETLDDVTGKEREDMSSKIKYVNQDDLNSATDKILFCIESITDIDKSEFIANIFIAFIYEKVSEKDLRRFIDIIQVTFLDELKDYVTSFSDCTFIAEEELIRDDILSLTDTPLFTHYRDDQLDNIKKLLFKETNIGFKFRAAFNFGKEKREAENY